MLSSMSSISMLNPYLVIIFTVHKTCRRGIDEEWKQKGRADPWALQTIGQKWSQYATCVRVKFYESVWFIKSARASVMANLGNVEISGSRSGWFRRFWLQLPGLGGRTAALWRDGCSIFDPGDRAAWVESPERTNQGPQEGQGCQGCQGFNDFDSKFPEPFVRLQHRNCILCRDPKKEISSFQRSNFGGSRNSQGGKQQWICVQNGEDCCHCHGLAFSFLHWKLFLWSSLEWL